MPRLFALLLVAAGLGLAACGPDSDDGQLSADEYRERGNRICQEAARAADRIAETEDPAELFEAIEELSTRHQRRFEDLEPPDELRRLHDRSVSQGREALRLVREGRELIESERVGELQQFLGELETLTQAGNETARDLGLTKCVADPL